MMLRLLLIIYMKNVKHFEANPSVVHPPEVIFSHFSSQTLSIFSKIDRLNFSEIYSNSSDSSQVHNLNLSFVRIHVS